MQHTFQFSARKLFTVVGILCVLLAIAHYVADAWAYLFTPVPFFYLSVALVLSFQPTARLLAAASAAIGVLGGIVTAKISAARPLDDFSWMSAVRVQILLLVAGIPVLFILARVMDASRRNRASPEN